MAGGKPLTRAERLLRSGKYAQAISLLEPQVFLYRESFTFYRVIATACLYAGDFGGAYSYYQRAAQIKPRHPVIQLGLAAVHLRRKESSQALRIWLEVLDSDPSNRQAKRGLALVRATEDPADYVTLAESGRLRKLFPPVGVAVPPWIVPALSVGIVGAALWFFGLPFFASLLQRSERPLPPELRTELPSELTAIDSDARYTLSEAEVSRTVATIGELFNEFRDNAAQREVNRLILSNASPLVKERMRILSGYFRPPDFTNFRDNFTYEEVATEPWLYAGVFVRWSGAATNVEFLEDAVAFVLLVGYESGRVLEGTITVTAPGIVDVQPGGIELIGRVGLENEEITLTATSVRRIVSRAR